MNLFCQFLALSTISLTFATLFKQYHYRSSEVDKWYYISVNQFVTFDQVSGETDSLCSGVHGGSLAQPVSTEETEVINSGAVVVAEIQVAANQSSLSYVPYCFFINGHDGNQDGVWTTIDGNEVTHFDWFPGKPSGGACCIALTTRNQDNHPLLWRDVLCNRPIGYICETSVSAMNFRKTGKWFDCGISFCPLTGMEKPGIPQLQCAQLCGLDSSCRAIKFNYKTITCVLAVDGSEFNTDAAIEDHTVCCLKI